MLRRRRTAWPNRRTPQSRTRWRHYSPTWVERIGCGIVCQTLQAWPREGARKFTLIQIELKLVRQGLSRKTWKQKAFHQTKPKPSLHYSPSLEGNSWVDWGYQCAQLFNTVSTRPHVSVISVYSVFNELTRTPRSSHSCEAWSLQVPLRQWSETPAWTSCDPPSQADLWRQK